MERRVAHQLSRDAFGESETASGIAGVSCSIEFGKVDIKWMFAFDAISTNLKEFAPRERG